MITSQPRSHAHTELNTTHSDQWEFRHAAVTDIGRRRQVNEDFYLIDPDRYLYVIADGMGGHAAGEVASQIAGETLAAYFEETGMPRLPSPSEEQGESIQHHMTQAIKIANASIFEQASERSDHQGMGTTIVALTFCGDHAYWAHVGDSRLYRLRQNRLQPLTRDHSLLEQTLDRQEFSDQEATQFVENFPYKNVLTRAVGSRYVVDVDVHSEAIQSGDLFVMTTDGVHDVIGDDQICNLLIDHTPHWHQGCQAVVDEINRIGGPDNITVACVEVRAK